MGRRQSSFPPASTPLAGTEVVDVIQGGKNRRSTIAAVIAAALQRANHLGSQAIATVSGLQAALDAKAAQTALDTEAAARSGADTALTTAVGTNTSAIAAETTARSAADTTLTNAIATEATARAAADTTLTTNVATNTSAIATETTRATTAEGLKLAKASNLSDVANAATALANLGGQATIPPGTYAPTVDLVVNAREHAKSAAQRAVLGNGAAKPLSGYYPSLGAAQVDYPHAVDLTDQLDWAVLQSAMNTLKSVKAPAGTYRTNRAVEFKATGQQLSGEGCGQTSIDYRGVGGYAVIFGRDNYDPFIPAQSNNYRRIKLSDLEITGSLSTGAAGGIKIKGSSRWEMARVYVHNFASGPGIAFYDYCWIGTVIDPWVESCERAVWFISHSIDAANQSGNGIAFFGGELGAGCTYGVVVGDENGTVAAVPTVGTGVKFFGTTMEGTESWGVWAIEGGGLGLISCYFESCGGETPGSGFIRLGNAALRPTNVRIEDNSFASAMGADASHVQVDRVDGLHIGGNLFSGTSGSGTTTGIKFVSGSCDNVDLQPNFFGGSVTTNVDYGALAANWVARRLLPGTASEFRSGSSGFRWRAAASYIHEFLDSAGLAIARLGTTGQWVLGRTTAGRVLEVYEAPGIAGTVKAWITDAGLARFTGNIEGEASIYSKVRASFGNAGGFDSTATVVAKGLSTTGKAATFRRFHSTSSVNTIEVQNEDGSAILLSVTPAGLLKWEAAANQQTTVGAAGAASALPATPSKYLKVVDSAGTTLVIPAYTAT